MDRMNGGWWTETAAQESVYQFFELFSAADERHLRAPEPGTELAGRLILSGGMGERGGVLPLAATMAGAAFLGIEADVRRIKRHFKDGECDFLVNSLDEALRILKNAVRKRENLSVGLLGNCADLLPEMAARGVVPDIITDQAPLLDTPPSYLPDGMTIEAARALRERDAAEYERRARESIHRHVEALLRLRQMGSVLLDTGNGLGEAARRWGVDDAAAIEEIARECAAALAGEGSLLRWAVLSGEAGDRAAIDALVLEMFPAKARLRRWIEQARRLRGRGFPVRVARLAVDEQRALALAVHRMVGEGKLKGAVAFQAQSSADAAEWGAPLVADGTEEAAERIAERIKAALSHRV